MEFSNGANTKSSYESGSYEFRHSEGFKHSFFKAIHKINGRIRTFRVSTGDGRFRTPLVSVVECDYLEDRCDSCIPFCPAIADLRRYLRGLNPREYDIIRIDNPEELNTDSQNNS